MSAPADIGAFSLVCNMERDLAVARRMADALIFLTSAMDQEQLAGAVSEIVGVIMYRCDEAEEKRGEIFRLLHPRRAELEREGWK
jgi:hypothetical protein